MVKRPHVLGIVLAGGEGKRLMPLTRDRCKPAVPFGANYRLVDFALSNLVNAGVRRIAVLTQYKSHSLDRHIATTWRMPALFSDYVMSVPAQMRLGKRWFEGSADAVYQNLNLFRDEKPDHICVFGSDHVYRMDCSQMIDAHVRSGAGLTVAGIRVPRSQSERFGVIEQRPDGRISRFREKPTSPPGLADSPDEVMASMGNYVFRAESLIEALSVDARNTGSAHDMGGDIVTALAEAGEAGVYDFASNMVPGSTERDRGYWRDVGTLDSYYDSQMDLISVHPIFNLYNKEWPIHTNPGSLPPAKFVFDDDGRRGTALDSMISSGVVISGATVRRSIVSSGTTIHSGALVEDSVILHDVRIGRGAVVRRAIIDKRVVVPPGAQIGVDHERDRQNGYTISDSGVTVVGKGDRVAPGNPTAAVSLSPTMPPPGRG